MMASDQLQGGPRRLINWPEELLPDGRFPADAVLRKGNTCLDERSGFCFFFVYSSYFWEYCLLKIALLADKEHE